jgi:hypothetical protein
VLRGATTALSSYCNVWAPVCAAAGEAALSQWEGADTGTALYNSFIAGGTQWAFGTNSPSTVGMASARIGFNIVAASDPVLGQSLVFLSGAFGEGVGGFFQNAGGHALQYGASYGLAKVAARHGLTLQELNLILGVNSRIGYAVSGTTFSQDSGTISGFTSRSKRGVLGVIWDINDTALNVQGLLDAISLDVVRSGYLGPLTGHSLGAARVNNLSRLGFGSESVTISLPFFAYPSAGSQSFCATLDAICGGALFTLVRPGTFHVSSPSWVDWLYTNHAIHKVPGYQDKFPTQ